MIPTIEHVERWADAFIDGLLDEEPAILLEGPRGSGKSTLLRSIAHRRNPGDASAEPTSSHSGGRHRRNERAGSPATW
ncbi:MAG: hypothetical protein AB7Q42_09855 [Acidimicrobiia bacterium]